jgi:hypothetical protein
MFRSDRTTLSLVMRGLDPRIHADPRRLSGATRARKRRRSMDCRVKPGNDALRSAIQLDRDLL